MIRWWNNSILLIVFHVFQLLCVFCFSIELLLKQCSFHFLFLFCWAFALCFVWKTLNLGLATAKLFYYILSPTSCISDTLHGLLMRSCWFSYAYGSFYCYILISVPHPTISFLWPVVISCWCSTQRGKGQQTQGKQCGRASFMKNCIIAKTHPVSEWCVCACVWRLTSGLMKKVAIIIWHILSSSLCLVQFHRRLIMLHGPGRWGPSIVQEKKNLFLCAMSET